MAAAPASKLVLAIFINDDESVGEFAAVRQDNSGAAHGIGPFQLAEFAKQAVAAKSRVLTLGGLDAMKRAYQTSGADSAKTAALAELAAAHADVAYDAAWCEATGLLASCSHDGTVRTWKHDPHRRVEL